MASVRLSETAGLLLAGGRSRRFGADKALAHYCGTPLMDAVAERFAGLAAFAVSARAQSSVERHAHERGLPTVHDRPEAPAGPLAGVWAGLHWANDLGLPLLATAPCDAPLLPRDLFPRLLASIGTAPAVYARTAHSAHPLCAVWRVDLLASMTALLRGGQHPSVRGLLEELDAAAARFEDERAFLNANTPAVLVDLERAA